MDHTLKEQIEDAKIQIIVDKTDLFDQAVEALRIVEDRSGVGLTTVTEVLRAQTALLQARLNLLGARYDYTVGFARTLLVTGQLNDVGLLTG